MHIKLQVGDALGPWVAWVGIPCVGAAGLAGGQQCTTPRMGAVREAELWGGDLLGGACVPATEDQNRVSMGAAAIVLHLHKKVDPSPWPHQHMHCAHGRDSFAHRPSAGGIFS